MSGYSGTPLLKKLGIKPGFQIKILHDPKNYWDWLSPLPEGVRVHQKPSKTKLDFIHIFITSKKEFTKEFALGKKALKDNGMLWISWPKKSSGVATDLDENVIRNFGLENGLVDVKVCAVDEVWSGLKFVFRLKDRK